MENFYGTPIFHKMCTLFIIFFFLIYYDIHHKERHDREIDDDCQVQLKKINNNKIIMISFLVYSILIIIVYLFLFSRYLYIYIL